jgi:hypothetical protein
VFDVIGLEADGKYDMELSHVELETVEVQGGQNNCEDGAPLFVKPRNGWFNLRFFLSDMVCIAHYLHCLFCIITSGIPVGKAPKDILVLGSKNAPNPPI